MALASKEDYNSYVLAKHDPALAQVFFTSSICNVYDYNASTGDWDKRECQGSLFLYSRVAGDKYSYAAIVMNRLNQDDFTLGITPHSVSAKYGVQPMDVKLDDSLLMVQAAPDRIYGLWLYNEDDRQKALSLIEWCIQNGSA